MPSARKRAILRFLSATSFGKSPGLYGKKQLPARWAERNKVPMDFEFNGIPVNVIQSKRKTVSIQLKPSGIILRAPDRLSQEEIRAFLVQKNSWIEKQQKLIAEQNEKLKDLPKFTPEEMQALTDKAALIIPEKVQHYAPLVGVDYGKITIRKQRTRWGSCSSKGNLNFNCLLMLTPDEVIDSVVVHELCHRKHMNHSKAFYAEVERVFPEYQRCHTWLKENGSLMLQRLP